MSETLRGTAAPLVAMAAVVALFLSLKALPRVRIAGRGWLLGAAALLAAWVATALETGTGTLGRMVPLFVAGGVAGAILAGLISVSAPPARFAWIAGFAGLAAAWVASGAIGRPGVAGATLWAGTGGIAIGLAAFLLGVYVSLWAAPSAESTTEAALATALAGWAVALAGFALSSALLLVAGGVIGAAGLALGRIVAASTGRGFFSVLFGGGAPDPSGYTNVRACGVEEVAVVIEHAALVLVVPGYGMALAGAQHAVKELGELLEKRGVKVAWAILSNAGPVPGYMNIVLDQANVPHEKLIDLDEAQKLVREADAVLVVGANDVINTAAARDAASPLHGLPVLDLAEARSVFIVKRSLRPGEAGVRNPLFEQPNTLMVLGDPKRTVQSLLVELKGGGH